MKKFLNVLIMAMVFLSVGCMPVKANENEGIITAYTNVLKSSQYQDDGEHECRYIIYDIDKNDIPELMVDIGKSEAERKIYFYTYENGQATCIGDRGSSHSHFASIPDKNGIMIITAHSSRQYAGIISVTNGAINEEELFYKYLTPEEYIAHNDGYYEPDELYSGSVELDFIDKNDLSGLKNYNYASSNTDSSSIGNDISVEINNKKIQFDVPPQIINDRTMVPMRAIFEELGYAVDWNQSTKSITATKGNNKIFMTIDNKNMSYNDIAMELDAAPTIINDRTLVPVRAISEASGYDVQWDAQNRAVIISTGDARLSKSPDSFVKLKNVIVGNDVHGSIPDSYVIYSSHNNNDFFVELSYIGDSINMTFVGEKDQNKVTITLLLYEDGSNVLSTTFNYNNGEIENLVGYYDTKANKFSKITGNISVSEETLYNLWATIFSIYDSTIMEYTSDIMLSDFGINYYINDNQIDESYQYNNSFYNAIDDVNKVKEYINNGLYLEASNLCDFMTENYNLSDDDKNIFSSLKQEAWSRYDDFLKQQTNTIFAKVAEYYNQGMYNEAKDELSWIKYSSLTEEQKATYQKYKQNINTAIENLKLIPYVGMTRDELINSKWGRPNRIDTWYDFAGTHEQWCYYNDPIYHYKYVFVTNGIVTSVSTVLE